MEYVLPLLILCLPFLTAMTWMSLKFFRALSVQQWQIAETETHRQETLRHLANLLASKDPLAFQQVQAGTPTTQTGYTGPILSGDEIELGLLEEDADAIDAAFRHFMTDSE